jgi:hypothetical protein
MKAASFSTLARAERDSSLLLILMPNSFSNCTTSSSTTTDRATAAVWPATAPSPDWTRLEGSDSTTCRLARASSPASRVTDRTWWPAPLTRYPAAAIAAIRDSSAVRAGASSV